MTAQPALDLTTPSAPVRAIALVLHGGRVNGMGPVRAHQLAVLRMRPFGAALRSAGSPFGLAVAALRYSVRGWNGAATDRWVGQIDEVHATPRVWSEQEIYQKAQSEDIPDA